MRYAVEHLLDLIATGKYTEDPGWMEVNFEFSGDALNLLTSISHRSGLSRKEVILRALALMEVAVDAELVGKQVIITDEKGTVAKQRITGLLKPR